MKKLPQVIAATLVENGGKFLLIKEPIENGKDQWLVPGGKVEFGESLVEAARREIKEETNLDVEITKLITFKEAIFPQYDYHTVIFFYLAKPLHREIKLGGRVLDARFFSKDEIKNLELVSSAKWLFEEHFS